jgi:hypothetical protein
MIGIVEMYFNCNSYKVIEKTELIFSYLVTIADLSGSAGVRR